MGTTLIAGETFDLRHPHKETWAQLCETIATLPAHELRPKIAPLQWALLHWPVALREPHHTLLSHYPGSPVWELIRSITRDDAIELLTYARLETRSVLLHRLAARWWKQQVPSDMWIARYVLPWSLRDPTQIPAEYPGGWEQWEPLYRLYMRHTYYRMDNEQLRRGLIRRGYPGLEILGQPAGSPDNRTACKDYDLRLLPCDRCGYHSPAQRNQTSCPTVFVLEGKLVEDEASFYRLMGTMTNGPGGFCGLHLDGLYDCLDSHGLQPPYTIRWRHSDHCRQVLDEIYEGKTEFEWFCEIFEEAGITLILE